MYREQEWFDAFEFSYDMSVPNAAHLEPQRGGCCTVMPYFVGDLLELPLTTTQDYSLFHILGDYSISLVAGRNRDHPRCKRADQLHHTPGLPDRSSAPCGSTATCSNTCRDFALNTGCGWPFRERSSSGGAAGRPCRWCGTGTRGRSMGLIANEHVIAYAILQDGRIVYELEPASVQNGRS